jgi:hypothetical protein
LLSKLFEVLDTPKEERGKKLDADLARFDYINGDLFHELDQFFGIEISEFPVRIAEVAMWMMDHIMNERLSAAFGKSFVRIPLKTSPNILNADALETDWAKVLAPEGFSAVVISHAYDFTLNYRKPLCQALFRALQS